MFLLFVVQWHYMYVCFFVYHSNDSLYKEFLSTVLQARTKDTDYNRL